MPLRQRLTAVFTLATLLLVAGGGVLFLHLLSNSLLGVTDAALHARAEPLAQNVRDQGTGPPDFPDQSSHPDATTLLTQVLQPDGTAADSSPALNGEGLLTAQQLRAVQHGQQVLVSEHRHGRPIRLLATPVTTRHGSWTVAVSGSLQERQQTLARVQLGLLIAGSAVAVLGAAGAWSLSGAALRPVERMRRSVANISGTEVAARVELPRTRDELASLGATFNQLLDRLAEALARQRRLVADAGHELRSPLAVLKAELDLASRPHRSRAELADAVRSAAAETDRLARLADDLLFLARSDDGELQLTPRWTLLRPLLQQAGDARAQHAARIGVHLLVLADPALTADVDRDRLRQALDNLLDNALRATGAGGRITLSARTDQRLVVLEVCDDGPGFPTTFLPTAFERFTRPDLARKEHSGGSGLGLAIVQAIAQAHSGVARATNRPGRTGATVQIVVPRYHAHPGGADT